MTDPPRPRPSWLPRLSASGEGSGLSTRARDRLRVALLAGVAGFVDAAGLLSVAALFPAHVTGELVSEAVAATAVRAGGGPSRFWMLPVFVGAVALSATVARVDRRARRLPIVNQLGLVAVGLLAFAGSGLVQRLWPSFSPPLVARLGVYCAVAAMGFQNALMREVLHSSVPTTFMTGNLTQFVIELVEHAFSLGRRPGIAGDVQGSLSRARLKMTATALGSFLLAALLGGWLTRHFAALSAILPAALVGHLAFQARKEAGSRGASNDRQAPIGMRRPTPIQRPLFHHPRVESGTRFKAVRLEGSGAPEAKVDEESA